MRPRFSTSARGARRIKASPGDSAGTRTRSATAAGLEPIAIEAHDTRAPAGRRLEREPEVVVTSESGAPREQHCALEQVGDAERRPQIADPIAPEAHRNSKLCADAKRGHGGRSWRDGRERDLRPCDLLEKLSCSGFGNRAEKECVADRDSPFQPERTRSLDHELGLPGPELTGVVQMKVEHRTVRVGQAKDAVEVPDGIAVISAGVDPTHDLDSLPERILEKAGGSGSSEQSRLRERHDLNVDRVAEGVARGPDALDAREPHIRFHSDVAPDSRRSVRDVLAQQRLGALSDRGQFRSVSPLVLDQARQPVSRRMGTPGQAPERSVDVSVGVHEPGQDELPLPIERLNGRRFQAGLDLGDHPVANEHVHRITVTAVRPDAS